MRSTGSRRSCRCGRRRSTRAARSGPGGGPTRTARPPSYRKSVDPPEVVRDYKPIHPGTDWREAFKRALGPIAVAIGAIAKYGFAFAKFASIFVAVGAYALIWGWRFAVGLVALILI